MLKYGNTRINIPTRPIALGRKVITTLTQKNVEKRHFKAWKKGNVIHILGLTDKPFAVNSHIVRGYRETVMFDGDVLAITPSCKFHAVVHQWKVEENVISFKSSGSVENDRVAAFDLDSTLIRPKGGRVFKKNYTDWEIACDVDKIRALHTDGYTIVIFTNQGGKMVTDEFMVMVEDIWEALGVPIRLYAALKRDNYRKPATGMWDLFSEGRSFDEVFYVGDAAGRKGDFSACDRCFAMNLDIPFKTPEEFFTGRDETGAYTIPFNPRDYSPEYETRIPTSQSEQEVVIMTGCPGAGKSSIAARQLSSYVHISRDVLGTWNKCVDKMVEALSSGKSVVIDNTNPTIEDRKRYISKVPKGVPIRGVWVTTPIDQCKHNERFRCLTMPEHKPLSEIPFRIYNKKFQEPSCDEGMTSVIKISPDVDGVDSRYFQFLV